MTQEEETILFARRLVLAERFRAAFTLCNDAQCQRIWIREAKRLVDACGKRSLKTIPLKVVPLAEQFIDRVIKDYGLPEPVL